MTKEALIKKTIDTISQLPEDNISEVADFAAFLLSKYEHRILTKGIEKISLRFRKLFFPERRYCGVWG